MGEDGRGWERMGWVTQSVMENYEELDLSRLGQTNQSYAKEKIVELQLGPISCWFDFKLYFALC
jgi:hypothetical protein